MYAMDFVIIGQKYPKIRSKLGKFLFSGYKIVQNVPILGRILPKWPTQQHVYLFDPSVLSYGMGPVGLKKESLDTGHYSMYMYTSMMVNKPTDAVVIKNIL